MSDILSQAASSVESMTSEDNTDVQPENQVSKDSNQQQPTKRKIRAKVDGRDEEFEFDPNDDKFIADMYSKHKASNKRFEEAAAMRKESEQFKSLFSQLQSSPERLVELASHLGHDFDSLAEKRLLEKIRLENMPEHERKLHEKDLKLSEYERKEKEREEEKANTDKDRLLDEEENKLKSEMDEVLKGNKPKPYHLYDALRLMQIHNISFKDAWDKVNHTVKQSRTDNFNDMNDEDLASLSEEQWKKIRTYDMNRLKKNSVFKTIDKTENVRTSQNKQLSVEDGFKQLEDKYRRK